jgi:hypothetical protein
MSECPSSVTGPNSLADLAARIQQEHEAAFSAVKRGCEHAIAAGRLLAEAKAQLKHGQWLPWLKNHCQVSARTAQVYMQLARLAPDAQRVADLPLRRAALQLQRIDRDGQRQAQQEESSREWAREQHRKAIMDAATRAVVDQLDQLTAEPGPRAGDAVVLRIEQLDQFDDESQIADDLIDQLLLAAMEEGISIASLFEAFRRRVGNEIENAA